MQGGGEDLLGGLLLWQSGQVVQGEEEKFGGNELDVHGKGEDKLCLLVVLAREVAVGKTAVELSVLQAESGKGQGHLFDIVRQKAEEWSSNHHGEGVLKLLVDVEQLCEER